MRGFVPAMSAVVTHVATCDESVFAEQPAIETPLFSKFTVPVGPGDPDPETVAVSVMEVPVNCGDSGDALSAVDDEVR